MNNEYHLMKYLFYIFRSHYVKNETLATVCAKNGLEKHLLHMADRLQAAIDRFLNKLINENGLEDVNIEEDEVEAQVLCLAQVAQHKFQS